MFETETDKITQVKMEKNEKQIAAWTLLTP